MRGEHAPEGGEERVLEGSSPRARGAHPRPGWEALDRGIIPACAGSTRRGWRFAPPARDHPRVRGEHTHLYGEGHEETGSSPRARGALLLRVDAHSSVGIIPACAGSTCGRRPRTDRPGDHPRVRGEHGAADDVSVLAKGSSPRARGAQQPRRLALLTGGIIPACAGSTALIAQGENDLGDHPRVRGEHPCHKHSRPPE